MKIAVDVMGGDFAPQEILLGAQKFAETGEAELILVGRQVDIVRILPQLPKGCEIVDTPEVIEMGEPPASALRKKKNASVALAARLVKEGKAVGFLSAGSTGAQMAASLMEIGRIPGAERPPIAVVMPTLRETGMVVLDVGANVDCKPQHLVQFAIMGGAYFERLYKLPSARIGLLNVGSEAGKGNELAKAAYPLLEQSGLNFVGNVEPDHMVEGVCDVLVCDGFDGNILLKTSEGISDAVVNAVKKGIAKAGVDPVMAKAIFSELQRFRVDAPEYSGAPLLGIAGGSIVCHGKAKAPVIAHALHLAAQFSSTDVIGLIAQRLSKNAAGVSLSQ